MNSMILAASGFMPIVTNILLVILVAVALLLCFVVLMQRPKQEGLGAAFGGGMTDQAFGARTTDVLQKGTVWLGTLFFVLALSLQVLVAAQNSGQNIEKEVKAVAEEQTADAEVAEEVKKVLEETAPVAPAETPATKETAPELPAEAPAAEAEDAAPKVNLSKVPWNRKLPTEADGALGAAVEAVTTEESPATSAETTPVE